MADKRNQPGQAQLAAGTVPWRLVRGELEVLIVHRPRYDDWSWPKGKVERGEEMVVCAARETIEETGLPVVLGIPLPTTTYPLADGRTKKVWYWASQVVPDAGTPGVAPHTALGHIKPAAKAEIDKTAWVPARGAAKWLSHIKDRAPLHALLFAFENGLLDSKARVVVRHTKARSRQVWGKAEATRPLTVSGKARAQALVPMLGAYGVTDVVSSPWRRCVATVAPYAKKLDTSVRTSQWLSEEGAAANPERATRVVSKVIAGKVPSVLCLHRPVIPVALAVVAALARPKLVAQLPDQDPYLRTGEMLVIHTVGQAGHTKVVAIERHRPLLR